MTQEKGEDAYKITISSSNIIENFDSLRICKMLDQWMTLTTVLSILLIY